MAVDSRSNHYSLAHSPSQQDPAIWTHFCSDKVALKAHLYEGSIHMRAPGMCLSGREKKTAASHVAFINREPAVPMAYIH
ncbi:hypothetical protein EYF80_011423 [Liparis tanakae]|uniref:Uncharacterized protein n=1 Tax=Liparis tanakae TaxID=230148 RepID=A0A4Z2IKD1_9TELE|nr:hypothetical protein EYF80_011423 [Liparis tanakae]